MEVDPKEAEAIIQSIRKEAESTVKTSSIKYEPKSYIPDMDKMLDRISKSRAPENFRPQPEWCARMVQWFSHLKAQATAAKPQGEKMQFQAALRQIESGEQPRISEVAGLADVTEVLAYFSNRKSQFSKSDLQWVFSVLVFAPKVLTPLCCEEMQNILSIVYSQLNDASNPLFPYLSVIAVVITKFYKQR